MTIHHSQIKKAEKMGVILEEDGDHVTAFWPKRSLKLYGSSAADALAQAQAGIAIMGSDLYRVVPDPDARRLVDVVHSEGTILKGGPMPPVAAHKLIFVDKKDEWENPPEAPFDEADAPSADMKEGTTASAASTPSKVGRINGVAVDGAVAYSEGTPAGDCPHPEGSDAAEEWYVKWDEAADAATEEDDGKTGTVVAEKYRAKYAEAGHPTHCGDWLAETLNGICLNKGGTNLELFEHICDLNGVSTAKYKRTGVGWEGRIRMTGRNLMAKKVYQNDGVLILPQTINGGVMRAPQEWMDAQRYKRAAKPEAKPTGDVIAIKAKA